MIAILRRTSWPLRISLAVLAASALLLGSSLVPGRRARAQERPAPDQARPEVQKLSPSEILLEPEQETALDVKLVRAVRQRGDHPLTLGGKISLDLEKTARIRPLYNVTVYKVWKHAGERVQKNDDILTVESTDLGTAKNNYLQAIANLEVAATTYRRESLLRMRHATTDVDFENARSGFRQAAVALMASREQCLLMGVRPFELDDLRKELNDEVLSIARPNVAARPDGTKVYGQPEGPPHGNLEIASRAEEPGGSRWEGLIDMESLDPDTAAIPTSCLSLRPASDDEREHDALVALAEIAKRFASPHFKNEEDGRRRARYTIRAPRDGTIISKDAAQGEFVDPTQVIVTVADTSDVWINLAIYQQQIASVEPGARVDVTTPAYPGVPFGGTITYLADYVDDTTHTLTARVQVDNPKNRLKSGMVAKCVVHCIDHDPAIELPTNAILDDGGRTFVIVKKAPGHYERREVKLGLRTDDVVHVEEGVAEGEDVALEGNLYIHSSVPLGD
jgi:multidrug efflux pump subunit AcrA (membrane-fusion protein)